MSAFVLFSSCSKDGEDPINPASAEITVALNENTNMSEKDTLFVKRDKMSANIQVSAVAKTTTDLRRIYIYKKVSTTSASGSYETYNGSGFSKDTDDNYYYDIPNDQRNNAVLNFTVNLNANNITAKTDEYYVVFTDGTPYGGPGSPDGLLIGPAQIYIAYGDLSETTGHRLNNIQGPNSGAFNLSTLSNEPASAIAGNKDMVDSDATTALWDKSFAAGNTTKFVKVSSGFNYAHATDLTIKDAYVAGTKLSTVLDVATGDMYVAKLRDLDNYVLIKVTSISNDSDGTGSGKNNEYMEFSVKK